jgi:hypothetical protein
MFTETVNKALNVFRSLVEYGLPVSAGVGAGGIHLGDSGTVSSLFAGAAADGDAGTPRFRFLPLPKSHGHDNEKQRCCYQRKLERSRGERGVALTFLECRDQILHIPGEVGIADGECLPPGQRL